MPAKITDLSSGIITITITGVLTHAELKEVQAGIARQIGAQGKSRILVVTEDFKGWRRGDDWGDISFQMEHDVDIAKMALIGEDKWRDLALVFTSQGLRPFPIMYFHPGQMDSARSWLLSGAES